VRIAAQLDAYTWRGSCVQVGRHDQRSAPVKREGRHEHPAVPDRHQVWNACFRLGEQQPHGVPRLRGAELSVRLERRLRPCYLPERYPLLRG
jgi:hypothetical protein